MRIHHLLLLKPALLLVICASSQIKSPGKPEIPTFCDGIGYPEMVVLPAGSFKIGAPADEVGRYKEEGPQKMITLVSFAVSKFDVTRAQWASFVKATNRPTIEGCDWSGLSKGEDVHASWQKLGFDQDSSHPVVCVSWNDANDYIRWLSQRTGRIYRLLSEAEWEYAARGNTTSAYPWGALPSHEFANYGTDTAYGVGLASGRDRWVYGTSPAGAFPSNAFGLYDMNGNVLQWVEDCFSPSYAGLPVNGTANQKDTILKMSGDLASMNGKNACSFRICRGGDFGDPPKAIRSASRNWAPAVGSAHIRSAGLGFRVAATLTNN